MTNGSSPQKPRAALYARVSVGKGRQDVGLQIDILRRVAEQREWVIADTYVDDGVSGVKASRPEFDRMMRDCHAGRIDVVCCVRFDRIGRSLKHLIQCLETFQALGIGFVSTTEMIDSSTPSGKLMFHVIGAMAEFEVALTKERVSLGVQKARKAGKKFGRPKRTDIDMDRVKRLLAHGHSLRSVAKMLEVSRGTLRYRIAQAGEKSAPATAPQGA